MKRLSLILTATFLALIMTNYPSLPQTAVTKNISRPIPVDIEFDAERNYRNRPDRWVNPKNTKTSSSTQRIGKNSSNISTSKQKGHGWKNTKRYNAFYK